MAAIRNLRSPPNGTVNDFLHVCTVGAAAFGTGLLYTTRRATGRPERMAAALMLIGMTDAMTVAILAPAAWFALMVTAGMALAAGRRHMPFIAPSQTGATPAPLSTHLALGLVLTATLILLMPTMTPSEPVIAATHSHGSTGSIAVLICATLGLGSVALAATAVRSDRSWRHRLHHVAMAGSTVSMSAVVLS